MCAIVCLFVVCVFVSLLHNCPEGLWIMFLVVRQPPHCDRAITSRGLAVVAAAVSTEPANSYQPDSHVKTHTLHASNMLRCLLQLISPDVTVSRRMQTLAMPQLYKV